MNQSKIKDRRFWERWKGAGAVVTEEQCRYINEAKIWLGQAKKEEGDVRIYLEHMRKALDKAGKTIKFLGTNFTEITSLIAHGDIVSARNYLSYARSQAPEGDVSAYVENFQYYLEKAVSFLLPTCNSETVLKSLLMSYLGTSEEEIARLLNEGYLSSAKNFLHLVRERKQIGSVEWYISSIRESLIKAGKDLNFLGSSEEEITKLLAVS